MHKHLIWLSTFNNCPNCWSTDIYANANDAKTKVDFKCGRCDWKLSDIDYPEVSKIITVTIFKKQL